MKRFLFALALLAPVHAALAEEAPGLIAQEIAAPHHGRKMDLAVWYPAEGGTEVLFAENPVFKGGLVREGARPRAGKHPVVLLSHGMGGSFLSLNWLATGLVSQGAVVVAVNHPNGNFRDRRPDKMFDHWTRAQDLKVALDHVLADEALSAAVDPSRIYAAGFSFGGWTVLSLAGVTGKPEGSVAYCAAAGERSHTCTDLKTFGFDLAKLDRTMWTASYKDERIRAVAAIDPGLTWELSREDVRGVDQYKLLLIGLGTGEDRLYATDTSSEGSGFEALVPDAKVKLLAPANHFTAMPLCKPEGEALLAGEKDDPVCTDPAGGNRQAVHDEIIALIAGHFGLK
ncbi:alpha/beta hydrolase family protein [Aestuariivirga sp.]|uniref:alpha/beta hydrolase family protein n=1 Tax=Aestuariivirga sp. TaxID=2650926 RepID=UPI0035948398